MKVLVVEDEPSILRSLSFVLRRSGFSVEEARDGEEGLEKLRAFRPDLVLLDIMMPRRNGYEVCAEIKADPELRNTYVVILSAKGRATDQEQGFRVGADEYLTKPFSPVELVARLKGIEARRAPAG